jgi:succinate dehydrogenase / fumarate reductase iron-sulfur subunit
MRVFRGDASGGVFVDYTVEVEEGNVILDVIHKIQATHANDLAVRWNCKAGMCMTRMNLYPAGETITIAPIKTFPLIKDIVADVSFNFGVAERVPAYQPPAADGDGVPRMMQMDVERGQEFRKCIECFLCQDVCHVIRDHPENKEGFFGPRFFVRLAELDMHPLDTDDRMELIRRAAGVGLCNITKCCTEVCPEEIHITDNAIIPLKERVADRYFDPVRWIFRKITGG